MSAICLRAVEFRATEPVGDGRTLTGYAAVFDTPTMIRDWLGSYEETIVRGAFKKTLRNKTPVMQFDHGRDPATGTIPIGSIQELSEDDTGLFVRGRLYDNSKVEPIRQAIEGGSVDGMSFRFEVSKEEWRDASGNKLKPEQVDDMLWAGVEGLKRNITEIDPLHELGPVVFPAYQATSVGVRSALAQLTGDDRKELIRELAAELRRLPDLTGRPAGAVGGGDSDANETASPSITRKRAHLDVVLKTYGVIE